MRVGPGQPSGLETEKQEFVFLKLFSCLVFQTLIEPSKKGTENKNESNHHSRFQPQPQRSPFPRSSR